MASDPISVDLSGIIDLPAASEDTDGLVELANVAETQEGTNDTLAVTPAAAAATYVAIEDFAEKGDLLVATGEGSYVALHVDSNGAVLTACSTAPTGLCWVTPAPPEPPAPPAIPCSVVTGKGVVLTGTSDGVPAALPTGANNQVLVACSATGTGLAWANLPNTNTSIPCACISGKGSLLTGTAAGVPVALPVGSNNQVLVASSSSSTGLAWQTISLPDPAIPITCLTGKGAVVVGAAASSPMALPAGANGQLLSVCSACPTGLAWVSVNVEGVPACTITGKGAILTGSAPSAPVALPVGTTGQLLRANPATPTGLEWSQVGKMASAVSNSGAIALALDNLRVCFNATGNRTWSFGLTSGTTTAFYQTTCAMGAAIATQTGSVTLTCSTFREMGWNFTSPSGCATYMICLGPVSAPTAIYCFVGMVGQSYTGNLFSLTRLF
jgi:hypothetical protein